MKKILFFAALVLGMASCQTEPEGLDVMVGGEQEVMLNVSLPESTRSASSAGFNFSNFESNDQYDLRFILEIAYNNTVVRTVKTSETTSATFPVRLAPGRNYTFTVWADLVNEDSQADLYYNILTNAQNGVSALSNITFKEWTPNVEARDAYTFTDTFEFGKNPEKLKMTLTRPFAKVRVVATDIADVRKFGIKPTNAVAEYTASEMYTVFDAVSGAAKGETNRKTHTFNYDDVDTYEGANGEQLTLFADYVLVPADGTVQFNLDVYANEAHGGLIKSNSFNTAIPVEKNKVTSIVGDVLTEGGNVSITVDGTLGQKETINYVDNAEDLQEIINNSEENESVNITLGDDIDLGALAGILSTRAGEPTYGLLIPADRELTLDLNGFTISQSKTQTTAYSMIENRGTLTIKDSSANKTGKLSYADNGQGGNYVSNTIQNSGVLTIEGGTIENNSSATVASNGYPHPIDNSGTLDIKGGTFTNNANYSSMRIWCTTDDNTIVTIDGGTFNGSIDFQTPNAAANKGTLTIKRGTFNADTYTKCAVRLLGFGADVDEMNGYIRGGQFNGAIALKNWSGSELNSKVFDITAGTFTTEAKDGTDIALVNDDYAWVEVENGLWTVARKPVIAKIGETEYRVLQKAFDDVDNGTIVLQDDITLNAPAVLAAGKTATLNLNGKEIVNTNASQNYGESEGIVVYGNLTIEGEGTIQGASMAVWARGGNGDAVINIKGGTFKGCQEGLAEGGRAVIYASSNNTVNIYGGEFKALAADKTSFAASQYPVLNVADNKGMINVYGGRFHNQNPAAPGTEPAAWNANHPNGFVALGYEAKQDGDWYNVKTAPLAVTGEVDYNGGKIVVTESPENTASTYGIVCPKGNTTIKNLTIDGGNFKTTNGKGLRGIYVDNEADVTLENVVVKNVTYAINVNTTKTVKLTVKNSTLEGWTSYGNTTTASFDNVKFECGVYANFKPYSSVTLKDCSFEAGFQIDVTSLNGVITFENCTYNGVVLTAANFATVAKYDGDITGKIAF